jgi:hypothetical protein
LPEESTGGEAPKTKLRRDVPEGNRGATSTPENRRSDLGERQSRLVHALDCLIYIPASSLSGRLSEPVSTRTRFHVSVRASVKSASAFRFLLWWLSSTAGLRSGLNEVQLASNDFASRWLINSCERHTFLSVRFE